MRKFLAIFLIVISFYSCKETSIFNDNETIITGILDNYKATEIIITKDNPYDLNFDYIEVAKTEVDKDGSFKLEIEIEKPEIMQLRVGNQILISQLYVYPQDELNIKIHNNNPDDITFEFSGKSAKVNSFHYQLDKQFPKNVDFENHLVDTNYFNFIQWVDRRREDMLKYYETYFTQDSVISLVNRNEISKINFEWAYSRNEWALLNYFYQPDKWNSMKLPENFWNFLKNLNFDEPYLHQFLERYLEALVWQWQVNQYFQNKRPTTQEMEMARFEFARNKFSGLSRDIAMALSINDILVFNYDNHMFSLVKQMMDTFKKEVSDTNYYNNLKLIYNKRLALQTGMSAPDFTLPNNYDLPISLSDFKGNYVFVFVGSSLYPITKDIIIKINELKKNYEGKPIKFMTISLENNKLDKWKLSLKEINSKTIDLYMEGEFSNPIAKQYMINALPQFWLIDDKGKIITLSAPNPNSKKFEEFLNKYLKN